MTRYAPILTTLAVSSLGVVVAQLLGIPLPFLLGPLGASVVAALLGAHMVAFKPLEKPLRAVLGVAAGAAVTPAVLTRLPEFAWSLSLIPLFLLISGAIGYPFFRKFCGFSPATAFYAAMPGGFQDMLAFGEEAGGHVRSLSLVHACRVAVVVTLIPFLTSVIGDAHFSHPVGPAGSSISLQDWVLLGLSALLGWKLAERAGLFGSAILGPLLMAAALSLAGALQSRPSQEVVILVQFLLGASVGARFMQVTMREIVTVLLAGTLFSVILCVVSLGLAVLIHQMLGVRWLDVLLAFSPGGQGEMAMLALAGGAELLFVVSHHILRLALILVAAPLVFRWVRRG